MQKKTKKQKSHKKRKNLRIFPHPMGCIIPQRRKKTRKVIGSGDFTGTQCDFTPLELITKEEVRLKFITMSTTMPIINLTVLPTLESYGAVNIVKQLQCANHTTTTTIIGRFNRNAFVITEQKEIQIIRKLQDNRNRILFTNQWIEEFVKEVNIQIEFAKKGISLLVFDVQVIPLDNPLLTFISHKKDEL
jgi:hypothetical protein